MTKTLEPQFDIKIFYKRLQEIALDKASVKSLLPNWWCEEFEQEQSAVYEAAAYIAKRTNLDFHDLINPTITLAFKDSKPCYKLRQGTKETSLTVSRAIAERLCEVVAFATSNTSGDLTGLSAQVIRSQIMQNHEFVTLEGILDFCSSMGIAVIHAGQIPNGKNGKKFDGMVGIYGDHPVILIANNNKSPARLAFILAHELGHIACGHIQSGSSIVDENVNPNEKEDDQEVEADEFAVELIYGESNAWYKSKRSGNSSIWGTANKTFAQLEDRKVSASRIINNCLQQKLDWDTLGNDSQEFIKRMAGIE